MPRKPRLPRLLTLRLPPGRPLTKTGVARLLAELPGPKGAIAAFTLSSRELSFVRHLQDRKSNLHIWRCHQAAACGDFIVVDMAEADPARRAPVALELKRRVKLKVGGRDHQLRNAQVAVGELVDQGLVAASVPVESVTGDWEAVAAWLGAG